MTDARAEKEELTLCKTRVNDAQKAINGTKSRAAATKMAAFHTYLSELRVTGLHMNGRSERDALLRTFGSNVMAVANGHGVGTAQDRNLSSLVSFLDDQDEALDRLIYAATKALETAEHNNAHCARETRSAPSALHPADEQEDGEYRPFSLIMSANV